MINRRDLYFIAVVLVIVGILAWLSFTGKEKFIPRTAAHLALAGVADTAQADAQCLSCHGAAATPEARAPTMPENHPLRKKNCRQCHRLERRKS